MKILPRTWAISNSRVSNHDILGLVPLVMCTGLKLTSRTNHFKIAAVARKVKLFWYNILVCFNCA